jgi:fucose permease
LFIYWFLAAALLPIAFVLAASEKPMAPRSKKAAKQQTSSNVAVFWAIALFFFYVGAEINMGAWLYTYAVRAASFSPTTAAYLLTTFWSGFVVGRLLSIFGSTLINPKQYVSGGLPAGALSAVGMIVFSAQAGPALWISVAMLGLFMAAIFPQAFAYVSENLGLSGHRTASLLIAGSFGCMLMPWLTGALLESISPQALPMAVGGALSLAFVSFMMMLRAIRQEPAAP